MYTESEIGGCIRLLFHKRFYFIINVAEWKGRFDRAGSPPTIRKTNVKWLKRLFRGIFGSRSPSNSKSRDGVLYAMNRKHSVRETVSPLTTSVGGDLNVLIAFQMKNWQTFRRKRATLLPDPNFSFPTVRSQSRSLFESQDNVYHVLVRYLRYEKTYFEKSLFILTNLSGI